jgi:hypothetical protein
VTYFVDNDPIDDVSSIPLIDNVSEKVAWGGHLAFVAEVEPQKSNDMILDVPFHVTWIVPDHRRFDNLGRLILHVRGFQLQIAPGKSSISGAGLGLIVKISDLSGSERPHLVLLEGELLCLGPYGPLCQNDRKKVHVFEVKSFIHEFAPESYCFESRDIFVDVTDDQTGDVHDLAVLHLMCRVNETDGKETPCVCADRDPGGTIQYFIGHGTAGQGDLKIPTDNSFELKVCCHS